MSRLFHTWALAPNPAWDGLPVAGPLDLDALPADAVRRLNPAGTRAKWVTSGTYDPVRYQAFLRLGARVMRHVCRRKPRRLTRWYATQRRKGKG